jgi:succinate dehydrogenase/fumarate reductase flavoprotein subunit
MAAYEASKHGVRVAVALKGLPQRCGNTVLAPGAIAAVGDWHLPEDSQNLHFSDTVKGGSFMNEQRLVRVLVEESPGLILELERIGALWQRENDGVTYSLRIDGGHSFHRCPFLEDRTGREMLRALFGEVKRRNVPILSNMMVLKLLQKNGRINGAVALNVESMEPVLIRSKATILGCGGAGNLYLNTTNPAGATGDGFILALEAGAQLMDMEFVQFYPLGFLFPDSLRGALGGLLYYLHLLNNKGERFMKNYDPERLELSTRDRVARAIYTEVKEGRGGPHGGVFGDLTYHEPGYIDRMTPALCQTYRKMGIEPTKEYVELAPTCHFYMGGVKVDTHWQTTLPGLFAVGENSSGLHGGNRLSQNALAELLVSGSRAGKVAAKFALENSQDPVDGREAEETAATAERMLRREKGLRPVHLRNQLRRLMWEKVSVIRTEESLRSAQSGLEKIEEDLDHQTPALRTKVWNQEIAEGLENYFLVKTARLVIQAALMRTESRGAHFRSDYPNTDNEGWLQHIVLSQVNGQVQTKRVPVDLAEIRPEGGK